VTDDVGQLLARATGFEWDDGNAPKLATRHRVEPGECEQAFFIEPFLVVVDEAHSMAEPRWRALGRTTADRHLHIVFTVRGNRIRVVHARDMNRKERTAYGKAQGSIETDSDV
jgi:uncharacterized DUF497 family protein